MVDHRALDPDRGIGREFKSAILKRAGRLDQRHHPGLNQFLQFGSQQDAPMNVPRQTPDKRQMGVDQRVDIVDGAARLLPDGGIAHYRSPA